MTGLFDRLAGDLTPVADCLGPFARAPFLEVAWHHTATPAQSLCVLASDDAAVALSVSDSAVRFAGDGDLIDYRSPLGSGAADLIATHIGDLAGDRRVIVDSLPIRAAEVVAEGLGSAGFGVKTSEHTVAAVLDLPGSFDEYLAHIGKKERHETRRKRRRFEAGVGSAVIMHEEKPGPLFDDFVRLHRLASGEKAAFMTDEMRAYFADLQALEGWGIDALVDDQGTMVAGGFAFQNDDGYFLYNSAFDQGRRDVSPGVVLIASLIEVAIERDASVFDFLKGDEAYKFRLGAQPRQLFTVSGHR